MKKLNLPLANFCSFWNIAEFDHFCTWNGRKVEFWEYRFAKYFSELYLCTRPSILRRHASCFWRTHCRSPLGMCKGVFFERRDRLASREWFLVFRGIAKRGKRFRGSRLPKRPCPCRIHRARGTNFSLNCFLTQIREKTVNKPILNKPPAIIGVRIGLVGALLRSRLSCSLM